MANLEVIFRVYVPPIKRNQKTLFVFWRTPRNYKDQLARKHTFSQTVAITIDAAAESNWSFYSVQTPRASVQYYTVFSAGSTYRRCYRQCRQIWQYCTGRVHQFFAGALTMTNFFMKSLYTTCHIYYTTMFWNSRKNQSTIYCFYVQLALLLLKHDDICYPSQHKISTMNFL
jgi:hypothetical protein